ncbi:MAG: SDR family oxidoreductase [Candidatus Diapherotrites archaeon]|jgi:NAD(P)-dependent dehydrogenase (short-subunit alcohol dehydrogenase family)|uniref:SDR family oxidoreductase n=1 Tax=Candidatus Iainarchaeum sp. TaxID=3101447 RepID=A0A8T5GE40_9ARCH|nr:SDR family oxidoreductase [Candidatus Diapherotrites archaeon]
MENFLKLNPLLENILSGKVIVITGAASGLGKAIALALPFTGAKVGLLDINKMAVKEVALQINASYKDTAFVMHASVTNEKELAKVYKELFEKYGRVDGLVNSAGIARLGTIDSLNPKDIKLANDVNINGYFLNAMFASKAMIKSKAHGSIINISSASARGASKATSLYGVAKDSQTTMVREWALDLGEKGIRVNALLLGDLFGDEELGITSAIWNQVYFEKKAVDKELIKENDPCLGGEKLDPKIRKLVVEHYIGRTALNKPLHYQDVINQIILLNSELTEKITGESIAITSGNPTSFSR